MGIDPGTQRTGFGLIQSGHDTRLHALTFGVISPPKSFDLSDKYLYIFQEAEKLLAKWTPSAVAIEAQFLLKNFQSAIKLGMAKGAVIIAARKAGVPVYEYTPRVAKKAITGTGAASKMQVQKMAKTLLHLQEMPTEDAADSLALAICHLWRRKNASFY